MDFYQTDSKAILLQIQRQEKQLKSKRRWLLGLPTSASGKRHSDHPDFSNNKNLAEFLLREDDVFFETVRTRIEEAFGLLNEKRHRAIHADQIFDACKIRRLTLSCLDDLSTKGLYLLASLLTEDSVKFGKTRLKLKRVVRELLPKILRSNVPNHHQLEIVKQLSQLLTDPQNFRRRCCSSLPSSSPSYHDAVSEVLYRLGDLPTQGLLAMRRKLEGVRVTPQIKRHRHGWARDNLINFLTETGEKMLSSLGEGDELQESLAKAMAVAGLSLKLVPGFHNFSPVEFYPFSPQIKTLHNAIVKAIWFVNKKGNFQKLKKLQSLLDPDAKVSNRSLRTAIKKILIDYLFECSDMDTVPKSLLKALAIINKGSGSASQSFFSHEEIEKEVECVFSVSAQMKQIAWDLLPNWDFDNDFAEAYMEELEESGDDFDDDDGYDGLPQEDNESHPIDLHCHVEGTGESMPSNLEQPPVENILPPNLMSLRNVDVKSFSKLEHLHFSGEDSSDPPCVRYPIFLESEFQKDTDNVCCKQQAENMSCAMPQMETSEPSLLKNQYLVTQEACDETSMIAYNFIGRLLKEFAKSDQINLDWGDHLYLSSVSSIEDDLPDDEKTHFKENVNDSVIIQVCEELIPSLPKSGIERLKQMLGS